MSDDDDTGGGKKKKLRALLEAPATMKRWHMLAIAVAMFALGAWFL